MRVREGGTERGTERGREGGVEGGEVEREGGGGESVYVSMWLGCSLARCQQQNHFTGIHLQNNVSYTLHTTSLHPL